MRDAVTVFCEYIGAKAEIDAATASRVNAVVRIKDFILIYLCVYVSCVGSSILMMLIFRVSSHV